MKQIVLILLLFFSIISISYAVDCNSCANCTAEAVGGNKIITVTEELSSLGDCILISNSNTTIDCQGHTITAGTENNCGVSAWDNNFVNITVKNCNFIAGTYGYCSWANNSIDYNNTGTERYSWTDFNTTIENNTYNRIYIYNSNLGTIRNNKLTLYNIRLNDSNNYLIVNNNISNQNTGSTTYAGIMLENSSNNNLTENYAQNISVITGIESGCEPGLGIIILSNSNNNILQSNKLLYNSGGSIRISDSLDNILINNLLDDSCNGYGIFGILGGINTNSDINLSGQSIAKEYHSRVLWSSFNGLLHSTSNSNIQLRHRLVSVNSASAPELNKSATITLTFDGYCPVDLYYYANYTTEINEIISNGQICNETTTPACTNINCQYESITFDVEHFDSYGAGDGAVPELSDIAFILVIAGVMGMFVYVKKKRFINSKSILKISPSLRFLLWN